MMNKRQREPFYQRLGLVMEHIPRYAIDGPARLARDAGLGGTTIYDVLHGRRSPSFRVVARIADAVSAALGKTVQPCELFSFTGRYPTQTCQLCGCKGCLPEAAYLPDGSRRPEYGHLKGGDWRPHDMGVDETVTTAL